MSARVLIIDDEEALRESVGKIVTRLGHDVDLAGTATEGLDKLGKGPYELVLTDFRLPDLDGLDVLERARAIRPSAEVVLFTGFGSIPLAVEAIKRGAYDFITKPVKRADIERVVSRAIEKQALSAENRRLRLQLDDQTPLSRIVGSSEAIQSVLRVVEQVAPSTATVMIEGPSGTGKELIAEALHALSPRRDRPLVKVNCGAIPETLLEAELFGYERGAFTGAVGRKDGRFALAHGGTLFLDEVGTLSLPIQAKLLRVLQDGTYEPLGGTRSVQSDCRIIAATNADLQQEVRESRFREDLYYRLNVIAIRMPVLRDRPGDVPLLASHFLVRYAARNKKVIDRFSPDAVAALQRWEWPGNIRELEHVVERAVVLASGREIGLAELPDKLVEAAGMKPAGDAGAVQIPVGTPLDAAERILINEALRRTGGNKVRAASLLGISPRTIYRKYPTDGQT
ncbi:MAG: sigma-54 dependent transcriptional regulator [Vicinamibacterales bacterium]|nr:sigma-54 dependent transcriptional regulator [Vicinamibacterales bacterium]